MGLVKQVEKVLDKAQILRFWGVVFGKTEQFVDQKAKNAAFLEDFLPRGRFQMCCFFDYHQKLEVRGRKIPFLLANRGLLRFRN